MTRRDALKLASLAPLAASARECRRRREELVRAEPEPPREPEPDVRPTEPFPATFLPLL